MRIGDERDDARRAEYEDAFKKDLKKRIDETSKYVRPKDGTLPFAFMYIPAEGIYYDLLTSGSGVNTRNLSIMHRMNVRSSLSRRRLLPPIYNRYSMASRHLKIEEQAKDIARMSRRLGGTSMRIRIIIRSWVRRFQPRLIILTQAPRSWAK